MSIRQRAVDDAQKRERREAILETAAAIFTDKDYNDISMLAVAERAGLAKGTLYLYFQTKEALFLAVLHRQLEGWFDALDISLAHASTPIADLIARSLADQPDMLRLLALLHTHLENNAGYAPVAAFKHMLLQRLQTTGSRLEQAVPGLNPGDGARTLLRLYALVIGLQHLTTQTPVAREVITQEGLHAFDLDFERELIDVLTTLLRA
jgi:AcrR family transcriptional regulator